MEKEEILDAIVERLNFIEGNLRVCCEQLCDAYNSQKVLDDVYQLLEELRD